MQGKQVIAIVFILTGGYILVSMIQKLSPDAIAMALGVLFGAFAGIPILLFLLADQRRRDRAEFEARQENRYIPQEKIGPVFMFFGGVGNQPEKRVVPPVASNRLIAPPANDDAITVEPSSEWQDEPYPIIKR